MGGNRKWRKGEINDSRKGMFNMDDVDGWMDGIMGVMKSSEVGNRLIWVYDLCAR